MPIGNCQEVPEVPKRNSETGVEKIEFVFHHSGFQIDIGSCICTAEAEEAVTLLPFLDGIGIKR